MPIEYVVAEVQDNKFPYVFDSRKNEAINFPQHDTGKRQLLREYLQNEGIEDIITIQEYVFGSHRQQIICWFYTEDAPTNEKTTTDSSPETMPMGTGTIR
jgi:hypothetical protein